MVRYQYPFPIEWYDASDPFGNTSPPWRSPSSPHRGADFNGGTSGVAGTPVPAVADGTVVYSGWYDGLGNVVSIQHPDGAFSGYCHLTDRLASYGQQLTRGAIIGTVGGTRYVDPSDDYAPHLHLTMAWDSAGTRGGETRFDPIPHIAARLDDSTTTPHVRNNNGMSSLFHIQNTDGSHTWALAGDGRGTAAWLQISDVNVANGLAGQHGTAVNLDWGTWQAWKTAYLSKEPVQQ